MASEQVGGQGVFLASVKLSVLAAVLAFAAPATRWAMANAEADAIRLKGTRRGPGGWLNRTLVQSRQEPGLVASESGDAH